MEFTCEQIGMDQEELQERVVDGLVEKIIGGRDNDFPHGEVMTEVNERITNAITARVEAVANEFVLPRIEALIEGFCLQRTNKWGEKIGEQMTFTEYLVNRAENYLIEDVNYEGKTKGESGGYSWSKSQSRVAHMIDKHLHYEIERAMKAAVNEANESIAEGLEKACVIKLGEIAEKLQVSVKTK